MPPENADESTDPLIFEALRNNSFKLVYQPIVSFSGDITENYAALLRLVDSNSKEYFPSEFMDHADKIGFMRNIDRWIISEATRKIGEQRHRGRHVTFFVSISAEGIEDQELLPWLVRHLREHSIKGSWMTFQFRSKDAKQHLEPLKALCKGLKQINCKILIDHFNGVVDEAALLHVLPIDFVKFGPEYMAGLASNSRLQDQLYRLHRNLKSKHLKTIALAVEDSDNLGILWNMGVNAIQGYFSQQPADQLDITPEA